MLRGAVVEARRAGSHPKALHPNAVRVMGEPRHRHQRATAPSTSTVRRPALRPRHHPVRPGARGLPGVPVAPRPRALEHPRPRARGIRRRHTLPAFERTGDRARDADRVPARPRWSTPLRPGGQPMPDDDDGQRPLHGRRRRRVDRLLHHAPRLRGADEARRRRSPTSGGATCGCCSAARRARPADRWPTAPGPVPAGGTASTSSSTTSRPRSPGCASAGATFRNDIVDGPRRQADPPRGPVGQRRRAVPAGRPLSPTEPADPDRPPPGAPSAWPGGSGPSTPW